MDHIQGHRQLSLVTDQIIVSGDLSQDRSAALRQLHQWRDARISHVLDTRIEWSDETLVAEHAPHIVDGWPTAQDIVAAYRAIATLTRPTSVSL